MLRRREFLKNSMVVATVASTGILTAEAQPPSAGATRRIDFVLFDDELEDSVSFARELTAQGARAFETQQDVGHLWFGELGRLFASGKVIAGLTSHSEFLVCAAFAREAGARVRYEGSHDCRGSDVLSHTLQIASSVQPFSTALAAADREWPRFIAAQAGRLAACDGALHEDRCHTQTQRTATHPGSLFSWVIA
jgi:hypothetical protein